MAPLLCFPVSHSARNFCLPVEPRDYKLWPSSHSGTFRKKEAFAVHTLSDYSV
jgi:hypothetical protein